jgi:hypothetical protein
MHDDVLTIVERLGTHANEALRHDLTLRSLDLYGVTFDEVARV